MLSENTHQDCVPRLTQLRRQLPLISWACNSEKVGSSAFMLYLPTLLLNLWVKKLLVSPASLHVGWLIIKRSFPCDFRFNATA